MDFLNLLLLLNQLIKWYLNIFFYDKFCCLCVILFYLLNTNVNKLSYITSRFLYNCGKVESGLLWKGVEAPIEGKGNTGGGGD